MRSAFALYFEGLRKRFEGTSDPKHGGREEFYLRIGFEFSLQFLQLFGRECRPRALIFRIFIFSFDFA